MNQIGLSFKNRNYPISARNSQNRDKPQDNQFVAVDVNSWTGSDKESQELRGFNMK